VKSHSLAENVISYKPTKEVIFLYLLFQKVYNFKIARTSNFDLVVTVLPVLITMQGVFHWCATRFCSGTITLFSLYFASQFDCFRSLNFSSTVCWWHPLVHFSIRWWPGCSPQLSGIQSLNSWFCHIDFALNSGKSKSILFGTPSYFRNLSSVSGVNIAGTVVPISGKIVTLGDSWWLLIATWHSSHHTSNVCMAAYFHICALRHIRPSLKTWLSQWLSPWFTHVCTNTNSLIHGHTNVKRLQSVQNSAARVVLKDNHNLSSGDLLPNCTGYLLSSQLSSR